MYSNEWPLGDYTFVITELFTYILDEVIRSQDRKICVREKRESNQQSDQQFIFGNRWLVLHGIDVDLGKNRSAFEIKFGEIDYVNDEVMRS